MELIICIGVVLALCMVVVVSLMRFPRKLNSEERNSIKEYGLYHHTRTEYVESIRKNGLAGHYSNMGLDRILGKVSWMYLAKTNDNIREGIETLSSTGPAQKDPSRYSACVLLTGFSDEQLDCTAMH